MSRIQSRYQRPLLQRQRVGGKQEIVLELNGTYYRIPQSALDRFQVRVPAEKDELKLAIQQSRTGRTGAAIQINRTATVATLKA